MDKLVLEKIKTQEVQSLQEQPLPAQQENLQQEQAEVVAEKVAEKVTEQEVEKAIEQQPLPQHKSYAESFENLTIADVMKEEKEAQAQEFKEKKEELIAEQFQQEEQEEKKEQVCENIIDKPNYDLLEENKKVIKNNLKKSENVKIKKKIAGLALAIAFGICGILCVTNCIIIDNMSANFTQIDETYNIRLDRYLKSIYDLDTTQKGMELVETYPEQSHEAGDLGEKSNFFDRLCNFISGIFGG